MQYFPPPTYGLYFVELSRNSPRKHTTVITTRYRPIRFMSDPWLNIQTASHFLQSLLVDQMYVKVVSP